MYMNLLYSRTVMEQGVSGNQMDMEGTINKA